MGFNLSSLFGGNSTPAAPAPVQQQPGNLPVNSGATDTTNPTTPPGTTEASQQTASPLADFADLWKPVEGATAPETMFGNVDPNKLMEAAKKTDFSKAITPDQLQAIAQGGQTAVEAFAAAMNNVAQTVYANSALATTKIVEQALTRAQQGYDNKLPGLIKQHQVSDTLRTENPMYNDPAIQPLIKALEAQVALKNPNATASELTATAKNYLASIGNVFNPAKPAESVNKPGETDWSKFAI